MIIHSIFLPVKEKLAQVQTTPVQTISLALAVSDFGELQRPEVGTLGSDSEEAARWRSSFPDTGPALTPPYLAPPITDAPPFINRRFQELGRTGIHPRPIRPLRCAIENPTGVPSQAKMI